MGAAPQALAKSKHTKEPMMRLFIGLTTPLRWAGPRHALKDMSIDGEPPRAFAASPSNQMIIQTPQRRARDIFVRNERID
jgi:hypothetical protein